MLPLVVAFATTYVLVPQVRKFAIECRVADKPNGRKLHAQAIPHLGGVAIFSGFFLGLLVCLGSQRDPMLGTRVLALLPALLVLFGLGLVDDLRGLRAGVKLTYQLLGAVCVVSMGAGFHVLGMTSSVEFVFLALVSLVWYVGICNSMNLIDGLDGLAAGAAALSAAGFLAVAVVVGDAAVAVIALSLIGGLLAFLRFNFHPARIFMGDTGSMFLGFALASLACLLAPRLGFWTALLGSATILGLPILDTVSAICRRLSAGQHIFQADGEHTHHRLLHIGLSHRGAVLVLYALAAVFSALGSAVLLGQRLGFYLALALGLAVAVTLSRWSRRMRTTTPAPKKILEPLGPPSRRPVPARLPEPARVVPVAARAGHVSPQEDIFASLPPAVSGPS